MINLIRPMLAASLLSPDIEHTDDNVYAAMKKLKYPVISTVKLDGIRALKTTDLFSRTLHLIPNESVRRRAMILPYGFDMELYSEFLTYNEIQSIVMSEEHEDSDKIEFHVLDDFNSEYGYQLRLQSIKILECPSISYWIGEKCKTAKRFI